MGEDRLPAVADLAIGKFDSTVYLQTSNFLKTLKQFYNIKIEKASEQKEQIISRLISSPVGEAEYQAMRNRYVNEAVSNAVKNISSSDRIVEYEGKLIQKIFPIYMDEHRPSHLFDFSANLYQPTKHFAGYYIDTLYFNITVIWAMTLLLFITLYFDVLQRFIQLLEGNRKYRRKERH